MTWLERINEDPFAAALVVTVAVLVGLVFINLLWLVGRALHGAHVQRLRDAFWADLGREVVGAIGNPANEALWLSRARVFRPDVLRHCLNEYMIRTSGDYREGLAHLYRTLGLLDGDLAQLTSWRWKNRMQALRRLATVVTPKHRDAILSLADEGGEIRLLVAQIIGRIGSADDVTKLLCTWKITSRLSEYPVHVMVDSMAPSTHRAVLMRWGEIPSPEVQRIVLGTASRIVPGACAIILPQAALNPSVEVRIAACHAGGAMTGADTCALLFCLAKDPAWEVRAQATKALSSHRTAAVADLLTESLCDSNFWVRQNAAISLGQFGTEGINRLREVTSRVGDRYARDAAEHVLTELAMMHPGSTPVSVAPTFAPGVS